MYILSIILSCTKLHGGKLWFARVSRQLTMVVLKICILDPDFLEFENRLAFMMEHMQVHQSH